VSNASIKRIHSQRQTTAEYRKQKQLKVIECKCRFLDSPARAGLAMFYTGATVQVSDDDDDAANKGKAYLWHWCTGSHFSRCAWWLGTPYNDLVSAPRLDGGRLLLTGAAGGVTGGRSGISGGDTSKLVRICTRHIETTSVSSNWCQTSSFT